LAILAMAKLYVKEIIAIVEAKSIKYVTGIARAFFDCRNLDLWLRHFLLNVSSSLLSIHV
jgi:hypothetical protein